MNKLWFLFLAASLLVGCSKKSPTTVTTVVQSKFITAEFYHGWGSSYENVAVLSDPAPSAAQCSARAVVAGIPFKLTKKEQKSDGVYWNDYYPFPYPATDCSLFVASNVGSSAGGGVSMPGSYSFLVPILYDTLPWGDVRVSWTRSLYANWYDLEMHFSADSGYRYLGYADTTLILSDTTVLVPLAFFRRYPSATSVDAYMYLYAHGGAAPTPGGSGNMTGDIKGFFYSTYEDPSGGYHPFYMGSPKLNRETTPPPQHASERRKQAILRAFGVSQPD